MVWRIGLTRWTRLGSSLVNGKFRRGCFFVEKTCKCSISVAGAVAGIFEMPHYYHR
jgi:hypothetical protein